MRQGDDHMYTGGRIALALFVLFVIAIVLIKVLG